MYIAYVCTCCLLAAGVHVLQVQAPPGSKQVISFLLLSASSGVEVSRSPQSLMLDMPTCVSGPGAGGALFPHTIRLNLAIDGVFAALRWFVLEPMCICSW